MCIRLFFSSQSGPYFSKVHFSPFFLNLLLTDGPTCETYRFRIKPTRLRYLDVPQLRIISPPPLFLFFFETLKAIDDL